MNGLAPRPVVPSAEARAHVAVDAFLHGFVQARALKTAFETGLVDALAAAPVPDAPAWAAARGADAAGFAFLCRLLAAGGVVQADGGRLSLTPAFRAVWPLRELLLAKLDFCGIAMADLARHGTEWLMDPAAFMRASATFGLFDYGACFERTPDNERRARTWMRLTTALTRHEALACAEAHDFSAHRGLLDVGGNSGEFAARLCTLHPALQATVLDLPLVCALGREHVAAQGLGARVAFVAGDVRADALPGGHDVISFKSMLHDWPDADACRFLQRAFDALPPGGTVLVYERAPLAPAPGGPGLGELPVLLFFRHYRGPALYVQALRDCGFTAPDLATFTLDAPFFVLSARKPA